MPPSGFSQKAINGLLEFVKASYEATLSEYNSSSKTSEKDFLLETKAILTQKVQNNFNENSLQKISQDGILGLVTFITSCYEDLAKEIQDGKDKYNRSVIDGKAIQKELDQIEKYLKNFTI